MTNLIDTPATDKKLNEIPEPVMEMDGKESEYFWLICQELLNRNTLTGKTATMARAIAEELTAMLHDEDYFRPWKTERSGVWVKILADKLDLELHKIEGIEKRTCLKWLRTACDSLDLSFKDLDNMGIPINRIL